MRLQVTVFLNRKENVLFQLTTLQSIINTCQQVVAKEYNMGTAYYCCQ